MHEPSHRREPLHSTRYCQEAPQLRLQEARRERSQEAVAIYIRWQIEQEAHTIYDRLGWNWGGGLSCAQTIWQDAYAEWFSDGWSLQETNTIPGNDCTWTWLSTYAHFKNPYFCFTIDTHTYHNRTWVYGRYDGTLYGETQFSKSGGCNSLLSFHWNTLTGYYTP